MKAAEQSDAELIVTMSNGRIIHVRSELNEDHEAYLKQRGISKDVALKTGIRSPTEMKARRLLGRRNFIGGGFVIPYGDGYFVVRLDYPIDGRKFLYPGGVPSEPYMSPLVAQELWTDTSKALVFCEGPVKALSLSHAGIPAVGLAGATGGGHDSALKRSTGTIRLHPTLLQKAKWQGRHAFIMLDNDAATNKTVHRGGEILAEALLAAGAIPHIAHVPAIEGQQKLGADDFLVIAGLDAVLQHLNAAPEWTPPKSKHGTSKASKYALRLNFPIFKAFAATLTVGRWYRARILHQLYAYWSKQTGRLPASETRLFRTLPEYGGFEKKLLHGRVYWRRTR